MSRNGRAYTNDGRSDCVISCDVESGCASGALAPHFTTSFTSSTTGHTFSSGGTEIVRVRAERNRVVCRF